MGHEYDIMALDVYSGGACDRTFEGVYGEVELWVRNRSHNKK